MAHLREFIRGYKCDFVDSGDFVGCDFCHRTFTENALTRHQKSCHKVKAMRTKIRDKNQDIEAGNRLLKFPELLKRKIIRRRKWREDHDKFIQDLLSFKGMGTSLMYDCSMPSDINSRDDLIDKQQSNNADFLPSSYQSEAEFPRRYRITDEHGPFSTKKSSKYSSNSKTANSIGDLNGHEHGDIRGTPTNVGNYKSRVRRVIKYYDEILENGGATASLRALEHVSSNLSVHKQQLEQFKKINNQQQRNSSKMIGSSGRLFSSTVSINLFDRAVSRQKTPNKISADVQNTSSGLTDEYDCLGPNGVTQRKVDAHVQLRGTRKMEPYFNMKLERFKEHHRNRVLSKGDMSEEVSKKQSENVPIDTSERHSKCAHRRHRTEIVRLPTAVLKEKETELSEKSKFYKHNGQTTKPKESQFNDVGVTKEEYKRAWKVIL